MMKTIKLLFFLFISVHAFSQSIELKGVVLDSETNEKLTGVHIQLTNSEKSHNYYSITNLNGEFIISGIDSDKFHLLTSYLGYKYCDTILNITSDSKIEVRLNKEFVSLGEIIVSSTRYDQFVKEVPVPIIWCFIKSRWCLGYRY